MVSSLCPVAGNSVGWTLLICLVAANCGQHPTVIASAFSWLCVCLVHREVVGNGRTFLAAQAPRKGRKLSSFVLVAVSTEALRLLGS